VAELPSGRTRVLTTGFDPAVSPDGKSVVFVRDDGGNELRVIGIGGSGERLLLKPGEPIRSPRWSPDGQSIVFTRVTGQKVCRIPPNVSVEGLPIGFVCLPDLPFFRTFPVQKIDEWGLSLVDAQGAGKRDLPSAPFARNPDWSARGVLYGSEAGIQVTSVGDGAESRALIPVARYGDPAWQPGGTHIAFQSLEKDHWEIFAANDDGANPVALTRPPSALETFPHNVAPAWSPDGKSLVYLSNRGGSWGLWVMNADGSNQRRLPITTPISYDYQAEQVVSWGR
jgi:TolB protein